MPGGEGIVPPQGFGNGDTKPKYFYGLPMSLPSGGGGVKVILQVKIPPKLQSAGGIAVKVSGDLQPYTPPPVEHDATKPAKNGSGSRVIVSTAPLIVCSGTLNGGGTRVKICDPPIVVKNGGGTSAINQGL
jgi:hypothetical protein